LISGTDKSGQSFPLYMLSVTALSMAMAWPYWRTNGSLLLTMLMHASVNNTRDIVPSAVSAAANVFSLRSSGVAWLSVAMLWICAAYFLIRMREVKLDDGWHAAADVREIDRLGPSSRDVVQGNSVAGVDL
jgi:hypothetical protein